MTVYDGTLTKEFSFNTWACKQIGLSNYPKRVWQGTSHFRESEDRIEAVEQFKDAVRQLTKAYGKPITDDMRVEFKRSARSSEGWSSVILLIVLE